MSEDILKILQSQGEQVDLIATKVVEHDGQLHDIREQIDLIATKVVEHDGQLHDIHEQVDLIATKVVEHDGQLHDIREHMATKDDIRDIADTMDKLLKLSLKRDEENTMISHGMRRHEDRIDALEKDVKRLKPALGLS